MNIIKKWLLPIAIGVALGIVLMPIETWRVIALFALFITLNLTHWSYKHD